MPRRGPALAALLIFGWALFGWVGSHCLTFASDILSLPHLVFLTLYGLLGFAAAKELAPLLPDPLPSLHRGSGRAWWLGGGLATTAFAWVIRVFALRMLPATDDEGDYGFSAQLLASGRLWVESEQYPKFFDRPYLINDGHVFSQYFLGWPALQVPFRLLGLGTGFVNGLCLLALAPAVYGLTRRLGGELAARIAVVLVATSPAVLYVGATELSNPTEMIALAWCAWATVRARDDDSPPWVDAAVAVMFVAAFWIRPVVALGQGGALLGWWALTLYRRPAWARIVYFLAPAGAGAALFLATNHAVYGGALREGYAAYRDYANSGRALYTAKLPEVLNWSMFIETKPGLLIRLNAGILGWPASFWFCRGPGRWSMFATMVAGHVLTNISMDAGVESLGVPHFTEIAVPVACWTACVLANSAADLRLAAAFVLLAIGVYHPAMSCGLRSSQGERLVYGEIEARVATPAIVFAPVNLCQNATAFTWSLAAPIYDPDLSDPVLWLNHLSEAEDVKLHSERFAERNGYLLRWDSNCNPSVFRLPEFERLE